MTLAFYVLQTHGLAEYIAQVRMLLKNPSFPLIYTSDIFLFASWNYFVFLSLEIIDKLSAFRSNKLFQNAAAQCPFIYLFSSLGVWNNL